MRVGIFDPYLDDIGGGEKYMMTIAEVLSKENNVDVFWDNPEDLTLVGQRFGIDVSTFHVVKNIFRKDVSTLQRFFQTNQYDAIIVLSDGSIPLVGAKKLFVHIQQPLEVLQQSVIGKIKIARVTKFFCNSAYTQKSIADKFHLQSVVVYPPVALHPKDVKKENIICHVGRFRAHNMQNTDYKKQGIMIEAFKEMVDKGLTGWRFILAVSFPDSQKAEFETMRKTTQGYPIAFLINQPNAQLWDLYSKAKIYWHASGYGEDLQLHPEYAEHFGIVTVEAMGAGVVPVVIHAGGQTEIVQDNTNGFLWDNLSQLQEKTLRLIKDPALLSRLSKHAMSSAQQFSDKKFAEAIVKMVQ